MKIVLAPDSFKGSLTAKEAAEEMRQAVKEIIPEAECVLKPMADGGEGTLDSLTAATGSKKVEISVTGPLGKTIDTCYRILPDNTAIIETATIAGLTQVPQENRNPDSTTSYGLGEVILDGLNRGCLSFLIGLGGSATNDGGLGMLQALGMEATDEQDAPVSIYGKDLFNIRHINLSTIDQRLSDVTIRIASDVTNPLCGKKGASAVFGPQKGATPMQVSAYDAALERYSALIEEKLHRTLKNTAGAGAAGGLGFAFLAIGGKLASGAELIAEAIGLEQAVQSAALVLTGEGQSDEQTLSGKAPGYVAEIAGKHGVPALLLSGSIQGGEAALRESFAGCFSIVNQPMSLDFCMQQAGPLLQAQTKQVLHIFIQFHGEN